MALPILPLLLLIGGGAVLLSAGGKKKSSGRSGGSRQTASCDALNKLAAEGPGVWPAALNRVQGEINLLPPTNIPQELQVDYFGELVGSGSLTINTGAPIILRYAESAYRKLCNAEPPPYKMISITRQEWIDKQNREGLSDILDDYYDGWLEKDILEEQLGDTTLTFEDNAPDSWIDRVEFTGPGSKEDKEAFIWLTLASADALYGSSYKSPLSFPTVVQLPWQQGNEFIRQNSAPLFNPTTVFTEGPTILEESNKQFDFDMESVLFDTVRFYIGPNWTQILKDEEGSDTQRDLRSTVAHLASLAFTENKFATTYSSTAFWLIMLKMLNYSVDGWDLYRRGLVSAYPHSLITPATLEGQSDASSEALSPTTVYLVRFTNEALRIATSVGAEMLRSGYTNDLDEAARSALLHVAFEGGAYDPSRSLAQNAYFAAREWRTEEGQNAPLSFVYTQDLDTREIQSSLQMQSQPYIYQLWELLRTQIAETMDQVGFGN